MATFTCTRCGTFGCNACKSPLAGPLCTTCASRVSSEGMVPRETFQESLQFLQQRPNVVLAFAGVYAVYALVTFPIQRAAAAASAGQGGMGALTALIPGLLLSALLQLLFSTVAQVSLIRYVGDQLEGVERTPGETLSAAAGRMLPSIGASILVGIAVGLGFLLCIVPGVLAALALCLTIPAVVLHDTGVVDALSLSWSRTEGHRQNLFLLLLMCGGVIIGLTLAGKLVSSILEHMGTVGELLGFMVQQAATGAGTSLALTATVFAYLKLSGQWSPANVTR